MDKIFVEIDDFWITFRPWWHVHQLASSKKQRICNSQMSTSEVMAIMILFHQAQYRHFKAFCLGYVWHFLRSSFPT